jgi:Kef-type K+ transport system membrane component KefB
LTKTVLILAVLLSAGFVAGKLVRLLRAPSVTGYILVGVVLGSSGLGIISEEILKTKLNHFTEIALMLIAFSIGEHLELKRLQGSAQNLLTIALGEISGAYLFVLLGTFAASHLSGLRVADWGVMEFLVLSALLASISIATAPAATLHVVRELKASGPLTTTLMALVGVDNCIAITTFGIAVSLISSKMAAAGSSLGGVVGWGFLAAFLSLLLGAVSGLLITQITRRLREVGEILTAGLAILLLLGEVARYLDLSPLLSGIAAGFAVVNGGPKNAQIFRVINAFDPPIYVLFFTLAGAQLHLSALAAAGWVGLIYFMMRNLGKMVGARAGVLLSGASETLKRNLGLALMPQAGVAIGLVFLLQEYPLLADYSQIVTPVVLAGVVLSELVGPISLKFAVERAGEANNNLS